MVEDRLTEEQIAQILQLFVDAGLPAALEEGEGDGGEAEGAEGMEEEEEEEGQEGEEEWQEDR